MTKSGSIRDEIMAKKFGEECMGLNTKVTADMNTITQCASQILGE